MKNYTGNIYNNWQVLDFVKFKEYKARSRSFRIQVYKCLCMKCNSIYERKITDLNSGKSKQCKNCRVKESLGRINSKERIRLGNKNPRWTGSENIPGEYFSQIKHNAFKRNIPFNLTLEDLQLLWNQQEGKCFYSGESIIFKVKRNKIKAPMYELKNKYASLDRLNPKLGYEKNNVVWVWKAVNLCKMAFTDEEFRNLVFKIYKNLDQQKQRG